MPITNSPFSDAVGKPSVPRTSTGRVKNGSEEVAGGPGRSGGELPEVNRDQNFGSPPGFVETGLKSRIV